MTYKLSALLTAGFTAALLSACSNSGSNPGAAMTCPAGSELTEAQCVAEPNENNECQDGFTYTDGKCISAPDYKLTGSINIMDTYKIQNITDSSFVRIEEDIYYRCDEKTGELTEELETYSTSTPYSISNGVLSLLWDKYDSTLLHFNGSSESLTGSWTRSKNKDIDCKLEYDEYDGEYYMYCNYGWETIKAVFTQNTLTVTQNICLLDDGNININENNGWKPNIVDCNTASITKNNKKITVTLDLKNQAFTYKYNGKSCTFNEMTTVADRTAACKTAAETNQEYGDIMNSINEKREESVLECMVNKGFPMDFFSDEEDESDSYAKVLAKKISGKTKERKRSPLF
ncbi:MAG: hypothetical protein LBR60_06175 [Fibrobacter sp.]|jgi:hypothetical protein|nr:hypothetical protein [Fibrobacter sp.]